MEIKRCFFDDNSVEQWLHQTSSGIKIAHDYCFYHEKWPLKKATDAIT